MLNRSALGFVALTLALMGCGAAPPGQVASVVVIDPPRASATVPPRDEAPPRSSCIQGEWCVETVPPGVEGSLKSIWGTGPTDVYAVGEKAILHHDGHAWKREAVELARPDDGFSSVWGSSATDVWAASVYGNIYRREGGHWALNRRGEDQLQQIWGTGPNDIYVVGGTTDAKNVEGVVLHFDGKTWTRDLVANYQLMAIGGLGPHDWVAAGWGPTLVVGGASGRKLVTTPGSPNFMAVWAQGGRIYLGDWTQGVSRWRGAELDLIREDDGASGLWGTGDDLYAVNWGRIGHYDGKTWTTLKLGEADYRELYAVWGASGHVFIAGSGATILHKWPRAASAL